MEFFTPNEILFAAIFGDSVYRAHIEMEGYSKLSKLDVWNTEVFNVEV